MAKERDPLDKFFDEVANIIKLTKEGKPNTDPLPKDINEKLMRLELETKLLLAVNEELMKKSGVPPQEVEKKLQDIESLPEREKRLAKRAQGLQNQVELIQDEIAQATKDSRKREKAEKSGSGRARKKKFRGMGDSDSWKPV